MATKVKKTKAVLKPKYVVVGPSSYGYTSTDVFCSEEALMEYIQEDYGFKVSKGVTIYQIDGLTKMKYSAPKIKGSLTAA